MIRAASYAAALGPFTRWGSPAKIYRAAGLTPVVYASAGRRRDGGISREGSVHLRSALLGLGVGLWQKDPAARARALRERGKPGGIIACALAHRAGKIAFAMVRDQAPYPPCLDFHHEEDVQAFEEHGVNVQKVARQESRMPGR
jgi:transposase